MGPYLGLAFLLILIAVAIASQKAPQIVEEFPDAGPHDAGTGQLFRVLWRNKRYRFGVVAQFANVAAQVCAWTYLIQYVGQALGGSLARGGAYLQASLLIFLASRFLMTWVIGRIRATKVLAALAFLAVALCLFAVSSPNRAGVFAVVSLSFCLSLMFPTIYGVALKGLGPATKFGAAGLVMAIVGGAIMPLVQGKLLDATSPAFSFVVPAACFAVVGMYALYDLKAGPSVISGEPAPDADPANRLSPARSTEGAGPAGGAQPAGGPA
jgi:FHS family L-fucose permease-like MFS transporter